MLGQSRREPASRRTRFDVLRPPALSESGHNARMSTRHRRSSQRLAIQAAEVALAAPQVVAHRVARMANAGTGTTAADRKEFALMGSEKVIAFYQSWSAIWTQVYVTQVRLTYSLFSAGFAPLFRKGRLGSPAGLAHLPSVMTQIMSAGLAPVHAKTMANTKRLSRRRRTTPGRAPNPTRRKRLVG